MIEKTAIQVTMMEPLSPKTTFATSDAANGELANEAIAYYQTASRAYKAGELKLATKKAN